MKQIESIQLWINGVTKSAEILNAYAVNVTLGSSATFYYSLLGADKAMLASGNVTMSGEAYEQWEVDSYAWDWIAEQLNLTIIGDYVPPVPEPIVEPIVKVETSVETETEI